MGRHCVAKALSVCHFVPDRVCCFLGSPYPQQHGDWHAVDFDSHHNPTSLRRAPARITQVDRRFAVQEEGNYKLIAHVLVDPGSLFDRPCSPTCTPVYVACSHLIGLFWSRLRCPRQPLRPLRSRCRPKPMQSPRYATVTRVPTACEGVQLG